MTSGYSSDTGSRAHSSDQLFASRYRIITTIGKGGFGEVVIAEDLKENSMVAIKIEAMSPGRHPLLLHENKIYHKLGRSYGIPQIYKCARIDGTYYLVMELLGPSLATLLSQFRSFTQHTVLCIFKELMICMENIHNRNIVHRDLKPHNIVIGRSDKFGKMYIIDFGLSLIFKGSRPQRKNRPFVGTPIFAALNAHKGYDQSYSDDLESILYTVIYLTKGHLPWQRIQVPQVGISREDMIYDMKSAAYAKDLCKGLPAEFEDFLQYLKNLKFGEIPNYVYLRALFSDLFTKNKCDVFEPEWAIISEDTFYSTEKPESEERSLITAQASTTGISSCSTAALYADYKQ